MLGSFRPLIELSLMLIYFIQVLINIISCNLKHKNSKKKYSCLKCFFDCYMFVLILPSNYDFIMKLTSIIRYIYQFKSKLLKY